MTHSQTYLEEVVKIAQKLDPETVEQMVKELVALRDRRGRLFVVGLGGSAANASHAVNDFRKLCQIEAYCPTDNVAELTATANDEGWPRIFENSWWKTGDALLVLSVGGGTTEVSLPLMLAINNAKFKMKVGMYEHLDGIKLYTVIS